MAPPYCAELLVYVSPVEVYALALRTMKTAPPPTAVSRLFVARLPVKIELEMVALSVMRTAPPPLSMLQPVATFWLKRQPVHVKEAPVMGLSSVPTATAERVRLSDAAAARVQARQGRAPAPPLPAEFAVKTVFVAVNLPRPKPANQLVTSGSARR